MNEYYWLIKLCIVSEAVKKKPDFAKCFYIFAVLLLLDILTTEKVVVRTLDAEIVSFVAREHGREVYADVTRDLTVIGPNVIENSIDSDITRETELVSHTVTVTKILDSDIARETEYRASVAMTKILDSDVAREIYFGIPSVHVIDSDVVSEKSMMLVQYIVGRSIDADIDRVISIESTTA